MHDPLIHARHPVIRIRPPEFVHDHIRSCTTSRSSYTNNRTRERQSSVVQTPLVHTHIRYRACLLMIATQPRLPARGGRRGAVERSQRVDLRGKSGESQSISPRQALQYLPSRSGVWTSDPQVSAGVRAGHGRRRPGLGYRSESTRLHRRPMGTSVLVQNTCPRAHCRLPWEREVLQPRGRGWETKLPVLRGGSNAQRHTLRSVEYLSDHIRPCHTVSVRIYVLYCRYMLS
jgi:hypothetical protein